MEDGAMPEVQTPPAETPQPLAAPTQVPAPPHTHTPPATGELGDAGKAAIAAERATARAAEKRAKDAEDRLKAIEDKDKSDLEKATARLAELEQENATEKAQRLRLQVATEHGVTKEDLIFLTGTTEEELTAQAKRLAERTAGTAAATAPKPFVTNPGQAAGNGNPPPTATVAAGRALYDQHRANPTPIWKG